MTSTFVAPTDDATGACDCCANRWLHLYRSDCLRCFARDMARGIPRLERARREELRHIWDAERMATLCRMVGEERKADAAAGRGRYGHAEGTA